MSNLIVVGDSFCSAADKWPKQLADLLNLNLYCYGHPGSSWWTARNYLLTLDNSIINNCEVVVACHTNAGRIPTLNNEILNLQSITDPIKKLEIEKAIKLYKVYIENNDFLNWCQTKWFLEFSNMFAHSKQINLHCFPYSYSNRQYLTGCNLFPSLIEISLGELDVNLNNMTTIQNDVRGNHFSIENNSNLANELYSIIKNYKVGDQFFNLNNFIQKERK